MPDGLTLRTTLLLVALAFGLTFVLQALLGGGSSSAAKPAAKQTASRVVAAETPGAAPDLQLEAGATVPALRQARKPPKRKARTRRPKVRRIVRAAPRTAPAPIMPAATAQPTPTAAPRYVPPAPRYVAPRPKPAAPKPKPPAPTATPPSGEFDTSGEP